MKDSVQVSLSRELADLFDGAGVGLDARVQEALVLTLFRDGAISSGKAAQLLNISKESFRQLLRKRDVSYYDQSLDDVLRDAASASAASHD